MKSNEICRKHYLCTGCEACANVCPKDAISMKADWKGFLYPSINQKKCIDCKLCQKRCPINLTQSTPFKFETARVYIDKNKEYLLQASSGGAFGTMARYVLSKGGTIFGCSMDNDYQVSYISINKAEDLKLLHGSKYVQSYVGQIYREVKTTLQENKLALFCGCPCQVAGLKQYLNKDYENLITMDLICHGVPSQPYFQSYVKDLLKKKKRIGVKSFRFRHKEGSYNETGHTNNVYTGYSNKDFYMTYFLWGKGYRPSCYHCRFADESRQGDFTIGDFGNNKVAHLPIDDSFGSSLILFNTQKAKRLESIFQQNGTCLPIYTLHDAIGSDGGQLKHPCKNDIRTELIYLFYKLFDLAGPKFLFTIEKLRFRL